MDRILRAFRADPCCSASATRSMDPMSYRPYGAGLGRNRHLVGGHRRCRRRDRLEREARRAHRVAQRYGAATVVERARAVAEQPIGHHDALGVNRVAVAQPARERDEVVGACADLVAPQRHARARHGNGPRMLQHGIDRAGDAITLGRRCQLPLAKSETRVPLRLSAACDLPVESRAVKQGRESHAGGQAR